MLIFGRESEEYITSSLHHLKLGKESGKTEGRLFCSSGELEESLKRTSSEAWKKESGKTKNRLC